MTTAPQPSDAVLRPFVPEDVPALTLMLHRAYAELGAAGLNFTAVDQDEETTLRRASAGTSWVLVADGALVGSVSMTSPPPGHLQEISREARVPGRAWLNQLAVDPSVRGRGHAALLWSTARRWAVDGGAQAVGLDTAAPATHLHALYSRWGFVDRETIRWPGKTYQSRIMVLPLER